MNDEQIRALLRQYSRVVVPDESQGFTAQILEFPGCMAQGETAAEALDNLEVFAESWIEGAIEEDMPIPPPAISYDHSGRIGLRLPRSLHTRAVQEAQRDGISLNAFLVAAVAEKVGAATTSQELKSVQVSLADEREKFEALARRLESLSSLATARTAYTFAEGRFASWIHTLVVSDIQVSNTNEALLDSFNTGRHLVPLWVDAPPPGTANPRMARESVRG